MASAQTVFQDTPGRWSWDDAAHAKRTSSYSDFDYRNAYGRNPFAAPSRGLQKAIEPLYDRVKQLARGYGSFVARPSDSAVNRYMSRLVQGQRNVLDEYVRRAASAGMRRGGANVKGGVPLESSLHHDALSTLARDYSNRLGEAMDYSKYAKSAQYGQLSDSVRNLENLLGLQQSYLSNQANWQNRVGSAKHGDLLGDVDWNRQAPYGSIGQGSRAQQNPRGNFMPGALSSSPRSAQAPSSPSTDVELQSLREELAMQRKRNMWEEQDRQRAIDARNAQRSNWSSLRSLNSGSSEAANLQGANLLSKVIGTSTRKKSSTR